VVDPPAADRRLSDWHHGPLDADIPDVTESPELDCTALVGLHHGGSASGNGLEAFPACLI
jgi:hypothetical protein